MGVLEYLQRLVMQVGNAVSLALQIVGTLITSGWYIVVRDAATVTTDIHVLLEDPTCGQEAQCTLLNTILTDLATLSSDLAALGTPQQAGSPVTLPTTPPAGYGGLSASATGDAVWLYTEPLKGVFTLETIQRLQAFMVSWGQSAALVTRRSAYTRVVGTWDDLGGSTIVGDTPGVSPNDILSTDADLGSFLARAYPGFSWFFDSTAGEWFTRDTTSDYEVYCNWSAGEFLWYRQLATAGVPLAVVPPVWPGLANVTYGSPQSMDAPNGTLTGPADGYKISIDAQPSWAGKFDFGTVQAWRNVGAIAFLDDETIPEPAQTLGFASVIYTPLRMAHSSGALYRIATGYHATATPYVLNS